MTTWPGALIAVGPAAGDLDVLVVEAEHRGHRAGVVQARFVHRLGPLGHQPDAVVVGERAAGRERGVLAEAVASAEAGLDAEPLHRVEDHEAGDERAELRVAGVLQLLGVGVEQQSGDVALGVGRGLFDQLPALVIRPRSAHAGALGALAGEGERKHVEPRLDGLPRAVLLPRGSRLDSSRSRPLTFLAARAALLAAGSATNAVGRGA
jgi:hypothetical protein